ncbi:MAG: DUF4982 domain-containing protein [Clostridia bacterium]|nr:DUF4982 domain-containing protein [Clostridia bacterium]
MELKTDFKFKKFELDAVPAGVFAADFNDSDWRVVRVPHDWGIEGDFAEENDVGVINVLEDGIKKPIRHTGRTGALPTVGAGVYRKWVKIEKADRIFLECDGIMWNSTVYVNGAEVGGCRFGYRSYSLDITDYVRFDTENLLAIYAEVLPNCGRWYSGGGIYRNLRLVGKPEGHIAYNGIWVRQLYADANRATFDITAELCNTNGFTAAITAPNGETFTYTTEDDSLIFDLEKPILWDVDSPNLYTAVITANGGDTQTVRFGVRFCSFTKDGFTLNGRPLKMNGVCMHHDLGMIGAAVNKTAIRRQIEIMKGMGVNAWRTSHNPPAPELLDLCDEMGILVMDEFFDEWTSTKVVNGYANVFAERAKDDAVAIIKRDRNHPSVIMWSSGNEVREQKEPDGWKVAKMLYDLIKATDPTRPVTNGFSYYPGAFENHLYLYTDVPGLNYKPWIYGTLRNRYPELPFIATETESCVSTRGVYHLPPVVESGKPRHADLAVSDYGMAAPSWAYYAERELGAQQDHPWMMGEFIWTGFDYLGEPTPYYTEWPARSSYFGVVDLAGLPKNRYYCYRSVWTDIPTLHIFPHWNWEGKEGTVVPIHVYTNYEEVELFINGESQGKQRFDQMDKDDYRLNEIRRFRLMWNETVYQPGEVTAVAYRNGKEVARETVRTAGAPHHIELSAYKNTLTADGEDLTYITAKIVDEQGTLCPNANHRLTFTAESAGIVYATDAGDQRETETFLRPDKKALSGMLVACIRSTEAAGNITVTCAGDGLQSATIDLVSE